MTQEQITDTNCIICGDCRDQLARIPDGSVDLIYMDPPFFSGKNYDIVWNDGAEMKSFGDAEFYTRICKCGKPFPEDNKFCAYCGSRKDKTIKRQSNDNEAYLQWLEESLKECYRVLNGVGSMYVHLDHHAVHHIKIIMDKIFDDEVFKNGGFNTEITWRRCGPKGNAKMFANNSDYILFYSKNKSEATFNIQYGEYSDATLSMFKFDDHDGKGLYGSDNISAPSGGYKYILGYNEKMPKNGYRWTKETMLEKISDDRVILKSGRVPRQKRYLSNANGVPFDNVWTDIENVKSPIYPTQKPEALLDRIIRSSSNPGDVVLDPFCGCGTAITVARNLDRKWIGIDISPTSCKVMVNRLKKTYEDEDGNKHTGTNINESSIIDLDYDIESLRTMDPFVFQDLIIKKIDEFPNPRRRSDKGIDGWAYKTDEYNMRRKQMGFNKCIQVKRSDNIGNPEIDKFIGAMLRDKKTDGKSGIFIAFSFVRNLKEDMLIVKAEKGISIDLLTVEEILSGKRVIQGTINDHR